MNVRALSMTAVVLLSILTVAFASLIASAPVASAAGSIAQASPTAGSTSVDGSSTFTSQLNVTGANGAVTYTQSSSDSTLLSVNSTGAVSVTGLLAAGTYTVKGTDSDASGDTGSWTYALSVGASTIAQASPTAGSTFVDSSSTFTSQLNVTGANGAVTYTQSSSDSTLLSVNSTGAVSVTGLLVAGTYTVKGTDSDASGDTGNWTYALSVGASTIAQAQPNTGATSIDNSNSFTSQLNVTGANGAVTYTPTGGDMTHLLVTSSGVITTNGLLVAGNYAINGTDSDASGDTGSWTYTLTVNRPGTFNVSFDANGGVGTMPGENASAPTALPLNAFTRAGYTFTKWNTAANGSGANYANGAKYPFTSSTTLYAQWRANKVVKRAVHVVTFKANHGKGTMAAQRARSATVLTHNRFTRAGYAFTRWNTAANGNGLSYANGTKYAFASSITLYAQWSAKRSVTKPAIGAVVALGPFAPKSSVLSTALEAQIKGLAGEIKASKQTNIALVGYGDTLTAPGASNASARAANFKLSQQRAANVEAYLQQRLAALGVSHYTIFTAGNVTASTVTSSATAADKAKDGHVIATIS